MTVTVVGVVRIRELGAVNIAFLAEPRLVVKLRMEGEFDACTIELGRNVALSGAVLHPLHACTEAVFKVLVRERIRERLFRTIVVENLYVVEPLIIALQRERLFHLVREPYVICLVVRHVVRKNCGELVRHVITDVVVGRVLPAARLAGGVVGVLDLLLEAGLTGLHVGELGCVNLNVLANFYLNLHVVSAEKHHSRGVLFDLLVHRVRTSRELLKGSSSRLTVLHLKLNSILIFIRTSHLELVNAINCVLLLLGACFATIEQHVLLDVKLTKRGVFNFARKVALVTRLLVDVKGEYAGCRVTRQALKHRCTCRGHIVGQVCKSRLAVGVLPFSLVSCRNNKRNRIDLLVAVRSLGFRKYVGTVIQSAEAELRIIVNHGISLYDLGGVVSIDLRKRELSTDKRLLLLVDLVHVHLIRKCNHVIPRLLALVGIIFRVRIVGVRKLACVDVALLANLRRVVKRGSEVNFDHGAIEAIVGNCLLLVTLALAMPVEPERKAVHFSVTAGRIRRKRIVGRFNAVQCNLLEYVEVERTLHLVGEGDVVILVGRYIVGKRGGELVWHTVTDVVVGRVLPPSRIELRDVLGLRFLRIVNISNLLVKLGRARLGVGKLGRRNGGRISRVVKRGNRYRA